MIDTSRDVVDQAGALLVDIDATNHDVALLGKKAIMCILKTQVPELSE